MPGVSRCWEALDSLAEPTWPPPIACFFRRSQAMYQTPVSCQRYCAGHYGSLLYSPPLRRASRCRFKEVSYYHRVTSLRAFVTVARLTPRSCGGCRPRRSATLGGRGFMHEVPAVFLRMRPVLTPVAVHGAFGSGSLHS